MYLEPSVTSLLVASMIPRLTNQCLKLLNLLALDMLVLQFQFLDSFFVVLSSLVGNLVHLFSDCVLVDFEDTLDVLSRDCEDV